MILNAIVEYESTEIVMNNVKTANPNIGDEYFYNN